MTIQNLKGFRDFYPDLMAEINTIFSAWHAVAQKYGYSNYDGPILESAQLWRLKSGADIPDEMYSFEDRSGDEVAIRPEMTPTLARMVAAKQKELTKPIRWYSTPRCLRHEAPQKGRLREHFQFNVDCLGTDSLLADAEVIMVAIDVMRHFGLTADDFYIRLGNRKLIQSLIVACGVDEKMLVDVCRLIDKKDKLKPGEFEKALADVGVSEEATTQLNALFDLTLANVDESKLDERGQKGLVELNALVAALDASNMSDFVTVDFSIMRGFDYYTSTVFEVFAKKGKFRAVAGGGRYENLVSDFGGDACPGVGFGMGDVVLGLYLQELGKLATSQQSVDYLVIPINEDMQPKALEVAARLRKKATVAVEITGRKIGKALNYANSIGAKKAVIVGPKELEEGKVSIKDLGAGTEEKVLLDSLQ